MGEGTTRSKIVPHKTTPRTAASSAAPGTFCGGGGGGGGHRPPATGAARWVRFECHSRLAFALCREQSGLQVQGGVRDHDMTAPASSACCGSSSVPSWHYVLSHKRSCHIASDARKHNLPHLPVQLICTGPSCPLEARFGHIHRRVLWLLVDDDEAARLRGLHFMGGRNPEISMNSNNESHWGVNP